MDRYEGPYRVLRQVNLASYEISVDGKTERVHALHLKPKDKAALFMPFSRNLIAQDALDTHFGAMDARSGHRRLTGHTEPYVIPEDSGSFQLKGYCFCATPFLSTHWNDTIAAEFDIVPSAPEESVWVAERK